MRVRTDLALEMKEDIETDEPIRGVHVATKNNGDSDILETRIVVENEEGAMNLGKPEGTYITLESEHLREHDDSFHKPMAEVLAKNLRRFIGNKKRIMVAGLGNREVTPDALGPYVLEKITMNRHIEQEFGSSKEHDGKLFCGIAPGVMSQTGMESSEIIKGVVRQIRPDVLFVIDSLASTSVNRLCSTIQITDTGISPGAGIGNNRKQINQETMGIPVIAIGVPTVVEAGTIVYEVVRETFLKEGYKEEEITHLVRHFSSEKLYPLFVTPKEIDDEIRQIGRILAKSLEEF